MSRRLLLFFTCILATVALAQDEADQEAGTESATEQSAEEAVDEAVSDDDFIPTKEVPADQEVNFPVDI